MAWIWSVLWFPRGEFLPFSALPCHVAAGAPHVRVYVCEAGISLLSTDGVETDGV